MAGGHWALADARARAEDDRMARGDLGGLCPISRVEMLIISSRVR